MGMERLFNAGHTKCWSSPDSCFKRYAKGVRMSREADGIFDHLHWLLLVGGSVEEMRRMKVEW